MTPKLSGYNKELFRPDITCPSHLCRCVPCPLCSDAQP